MISERPSRMDRLARARSHLIARRLWLLAAGWLATLAAWLTVFVLLGRITVLAGTALLAGHGLVLAGVVAAGRTHPTAPWLRALACATGVALGTAAIVVCTVIGVSGDVLAFVLLTLYLMTALLFAWGWRAELALLAGTMVPWALASDRLGYHVAIPELLTAVAVGSVLCLAVAEGAARVFRLALLRRESAEEAALALAVSRDAYRDIAESARDYIWASDLQGRVTYVNDAGARVLGLTPSAMVGHSALGFLTDHPANPTFASIVARLLARARVPPVLTQWRTVDGPRWVEIVSTLVRGTDGAPVGIRGIGRDVDDRVRVEDALRASESRYRSLVETQSEAIVRWDHEGRLTFANEYWLRITGRTADETLGHRHVDLVHPDDRESVEEALERVREGGGREWRRNRIATVDGYRWFEWEGSAITDPTGRIVEFQGVGRDVHERCEAEEALRASEARYRGLVESQEELVVRLDPSGQVTFANEACERKFGLSRATVVGQRLPLIHEDDAAVVLEALARVQQPPYRAQVECRETTPEGWRWFEWDAVAIHERGALVEIQAVGRDVTERRAAQEALHRSLGDLQRSQDQLRSLAQRQVEIREQERKRLGLDLHDDVCQELVGIGILLESMRRRLGPISAESAGEFARVGRYLDQLVDHLRLLARELQPLQLQDLGLEGSLRSLTKGLSSETCAVESLFPTRIPRLAEEAEVGVYRIAQEALTNAIRHADARDIRLMLAAMGSVLRLEVSDDGCGFDPSDRSNALGLVSMEERALSLGGRLTIWSSPGGGTTVRLECPIGESRSASAA